jgi:hypothetical protein
MTPAAFRCAIATDSGNTRGMTSIDEDGKAPTGFPEPSGKDPGDRSRQVTPYSSLNTPVGEPLADDRAESGGGDVPQGVDSDQ